MYEQTKFKEIDDLNCVQILKKSQHHLLSYIGIMHNFWNLRIYVDLNFVVPRVRIIPTVS